MDKNNINPSESYINPSESYILNTQLKVSPFACKPSRIDTFFVLEGYVQPASHFFGIAHPQLVE